MSLTNGRQANHARLATGLPPVKNEASAGPDELTELADGIKADLGAAKQSRGDMLLRYRSAGEKLIQAKQLVDHGEWGKWLTENFALKERQAQRYMDFAKSKTDVTTDLEKAEKEWRAT